MPPKNENRLLLRDNDLMANRKYRQREVYQRPDGSYITRNKINLEKPDKEYKKNGRPLSTIPSSGKKIDPKSERDIQNRLERAAFGRSLEGISERELQARIDTGLIREPRNIRSTPYMSLDISRITKSIRPSEQTKTEATGTGITDLIKYYIFGQ